MRRMRKICSCFWITACGLLILMQFAMFRFFDKNNSKFMSLLQMQKATVVNYHDLCHAPNNSRIVIMDFFIHRNERSKVDFVTNKVQDTIDNYSRNRTEHDHLTIVFERGNFYIRPVNLTSHMTLCVLPTAQILASNDIDDYSLLEPLPSYGQGREMPGYESLILHVYSPLVLVTTISSNYSMPPTVPSQVAAVSMAEVWFGGWNSIIIH